MEGKDSFQNPDSRRIIMATANAKYTFEITSDEVLAPHPKSGLATVVVQGLCTNSDGISFDFIATNNLDQRYPERFKVNWNGSKARMPEVVGLGLSDDVRSAGKVSKDLYFTRGARIAIAKKCITIFPLSKQKAGAIGEEATEDAS
jgi:hypothetical protein